MFDTKGEIFIFYTQCQIWCPVRFTSMWHFPIQMLHHIKERARKMWQESSSLLQIKSLEYNLSCCVERNLFLSQNFVSRLFCTFAACLMAGSVVTLTNKNYYFLIICSTFKIHFCLGYKGRNWLNSLEMHACLGETKRNGDNSILFPLKQIPYLKK